MNLGARQVIFGMFFTAILLNNLVYSVSLPTFSYCHVFVYVCE